MSDQTVGATVNISVDASKLSSGVNAAQQTFNSFTSNLKSGMSDAQTAMSGAAGAADNLGNSTKNLGEAISSTGSRRELSESLRVMRSGASGAGGAFEALRAVLVTFGSSLGGPALVAISAGIAALAMLVKGIIDTVEAQKQLNLDAEALRLPVDDLEAYTSGMKELAMMLMSVKLGMTDLKSSQTDLFKLLGVDPQSADAGKAILVAIGNEAVDQAEKIRQVSIAFGGISYDDAKKKLELFEDESKQSAHSWLEDLVTTIAAAESGFGGDTGDNVVQSKGDVNGNKPNSNGDAGAAARTQKQIEDRQKLNDTLNSLDEQRETSAVSTMQNESEKILALAAIETQKLLDEKKKQMDANASNPEAQQQIGTDYDLLIAQKSADAKVRAKQVSDEQQLAEATKFNSEMASITNAGESEDISANLSASEQIIANGQKKIAALKAQLQAYYNSPEFQKLSAPDKAAKTSSLNSAFDTTSSTITADSATKAAQVAQTQQLADEKAFQAQMASIDKQAAEAKIALMTDPAAKAQAEGDLKLQEEQAQLDKELVQLQDNLNKKLISETQYEQEVADVKSKYAALEVTQAQTTAHNVLQANPVNALLTSWNNLSLNMQQGMASAMTSIVNGLTQLMLTGKLNMASLTQAILSDLMKIVLEKEIAGIVGNLVGGIGSGGGTTVSAPSGSNFDGSIGSGMAGGGTVMGGVPIPVGERGPEVFTPSTSGTITPNSALGGNGSPNISINMQTMGTAQKVKSATPTQTPGGMVIQIVLDDLRTGGPMTQGIQGKFGLKNQSYS